MIPRPHIRPDLGWLTMHHSMAPKCKVADIPVTDLSRDELEALAVYLVGKALGYVTAVMHTSEDK